MTDPTPAIRRGAPRPHPGGAASIADRLVGALVDAMGIPGAAAGLSFDRRLVWSRHVGSADVTTGEPITAETRFRLGSISKSLTGTLAARLAEEGEIDLDRPVLDHLGRVPDHYATLTLREILTFTSGIPSYASEAEQLNGAHYRSAAEMLPLFVERPLGHAPGQGYLYSSYAYVFAAVVMEAATGLDFPTIMRRYLLEPLGMRDTALEDRTRPDPRLSRLYDLAAEGGVAPAAPVDFHGRAASSGYVSNVTDTLRFAEAHLGPGFLSAESLEQLALRPASGERAGSPWGLGWRRRMDADRRQVMFGEGQTVGCNGCALAYPEQKAAFAFLSNLGGYRMQRVGLQPIVECFLAEREGTLGAFPRDLTGSWSLADAITGEPTGALRIVSEGYTVTGSCAMTRLPELAITDGFGVGVDGRLIATRPDIGVQPLRIRRTKRIMLNLPGTGMVAVMERPQGLASGDTPTRR